jgi:hypothetical protein
MANNKKPDDAEQRQGGASQLRSDTLVQKLVPNPSQHEPSVMFVGFVGEGAQPGIWRLYLGPELSDYVEFSDQDVVHTDPISADESSLGGSRVWLRSGTNVRYTHITSQQVQADFLQGAITSTFMGGSAPALQGRAARAASGVACTRNYVCSTNPHIPVCQERTENCGSAFCNPSTAFCPTGVFIQGC